MLLGTSHNCLVSHNLYEHYWFSWINHEIKTSSQWKTRQLCNVPTNMHLQLNKPWMIEYWSWTWIETPKFSWWICSLRKSTFVHFRNNNTLDHTSCRNEITKSRNWEARSPTLKILVCYVLRMHTTSASAYRRRRLNIYRESGMNRSDHQMGTTTISDWWSWLNQI